MIAAMQALSQPVTEPSDQEATSALLLALEEPEIYQHPVRARHFARVLHELSDQPGIQVAMATHSRYFVRPERFASLRRFRIDNAQFQVRSTTVADVAAAVNTDELKILQRLILDVNGEFGEAFFADYVVLVEGATDKIVIEALAARLGMPLDSLDIAVASVNGKGSLQIPAVVLQSLDIPFYVVADGDYGTADRKVYKCEEHRKQAILSNQTNTEKLLKWLEELLPRDDREVQEIVFGSDSYVGASWAIWHSDLEEEMEMWPGLEDALKTAGGSLRGSGSKNVAVYQAAIENCDIEEVPDSLRQLIEAVSRIAT